MSNDATVMGSFQDVESAVAALDGLRAMGIGEQDIDVTSSVPFSSGILGRPHLKSRLPLISLVSAAAGFLTGLFFTAITPNLYIIRVGGQPVVPTPPTALLLYEFTMLFLIVGTFGGFMYLNRFPKKTPVPYDPRLTNGRVDVVAHLPADRKTEAMRVLEEHGAEEVREPDWRAL